MDWAAARIKNGAATPSAAFTQDVKHLRSHSWSGASDLHSICGSTASAGQRSSAGDIEHEMRAYIKWLESNLIVERESFDERVSHLQDICLRWWSSLAGTP
jgi:hypothetical protein